MAHDRVCGRQKASQNLLLLPVRREREGKKLKKEIKIKIKKRADSTFVFLFQEPLAGALCADQETGRKGNRKAGCGGSVPKKKIYLKNNFIRTSSSRGCIRSTGIFYFFIFKITGRQHAQKQRTHTHTHARTHTRTHARTHTHPNPPYTRRARVDSECKGGGVRGWGGVGGQGGLPGGQGEGETGKSARSWHICCFTAALLLLY